MTDLAQLIADLEAAGEGSRAFDNRIALVTGWLRVLPSKSPYRDGHWWHPDDVRDGQVVLDSLHGTDMWKRPPAFSTSLDAALTLVATPQYVVRTDAPAILGEGGAYAGVDDASALAATAPLALCIAALKARQAQEKAA